ncbi:hypothetical protein RND81_08G119600 [Saponaria officinalis]|uniref:RanBD1 domain-containing protein n=1 Tax=Saponaria officinalis TaxID=3572 RepID=A0AAW1J6D1_SAPOF
MLGKKRRNDSLSSNSDANPFQIKRVSPESLFSGQATAGAELKLAAAPSLDRRKAARQHVRALNSEFASWVQSQLRDHEDELWEDGVSVYLTHASDIMDKFSDVVNWLKTNGGNDGSAPTAEAENIQKTNGPETISKEITVPVKSLFGMQGNNIGQTSSINPGVSNTPTNTHGSMSYSAPTWSFGLSSSSQSLSQSSTAGHTIAWDPVAFSNSKTTSPAKEAGSSVASGSGISSSNQTTPPMLASGTGVFSASSTTSGLFSTSSTTSFSTAPSFTTPWSTGAFANSQTTFNFGGNHTSAPTTIATEGADEEDEPEQPSSPSLKKSEEEGIATVHETKCKLFVKSTDPADKEPWKDKGIGQLFIKCEEGASKGSKESKPRILVRNDVGRIMLNASLYSGIKTNLQKNAIVAIFHTLDESAGDGGSAKAVARTFLIRVKNEDERNKLADAIREHAPAA